MEIKKIIYVEDNVLKYADVCRFLQRQGYMHVDHTRNAAETIEAITTAEGAGNPYSLLIADMHFDFYGTDDREAGEKTMKMLREKGCNIPVIFCSSQNWQIDGAVGNIFYHPNRYWELEAEKLLRKVKDY